MFVSNGRGISGGQDTINNVLIRSTDENIINLNKDKIHAYLTSIP